jgi:hypothetical protein
MEDSVLGKRITGLKGKGKAPVKETVSRSSLLSKHDVRLNPIPVSKLELTESDSASDSVLGKCSSDVSDYHPEDEYFSTTESYPAQIAGEAEEASSSSQKIAKPTKGKTGGTTVSRHVH